MGEAFRLAIFQPLTIGAFALTEPFELLKRGWIVGNFNSTTMNSAGWDLFATRGSRSVKIRVKAKRQGVANFRWAAKADGKVFIGNNGDDDDFVAAVSFEADGTYQTYVLPAHEVERTLVAEHGAWIAASTSFSVSATQSRKTPMKISSLFLKRRYSAGRDTLAASARSLMFTRLYTKFMERADGGRLPSPPRVVAKTIVKSVQARKPKTRYCAPTPQRMAAIFAAERRPIFPSEYGTRNEKPQNCAKIAGRIGRVDLRSDWLAARKGFERL